VRIEAGPVVEPLEPQVLAARREVVHANRRARKAAKPAYVNTDASWQEGLAGLAYVGALGIRVELVACGDNHEAEYLALLMAMEDADRCLAGRIAFRMDSQTVFNLQSGTSGQFDHLRKRVKLLLARHPEWTLVLVEGKRNRTADELSRRPFKQARGTPDARKASPRSRRENNGRKRA
jgi:ribonuclease HI